MNQVAELNELLGYPYAVFAPTGLRHKQRGEAVVPPSQLGHGVLSQYPIIGLEQLFLTQAEGDADIRTLLNVDIKTPEGVRYFSSIHFSNSDSGSVAHFREMLSMLKLSGKPRVLAGDFNIFNLSQLKNEYGAEYSSSADVFSYISYPERQGTLDYILLPKGCIFSAFECVDEPLSDHRALVADVEFAK